MLSVPGRVNHLNDNLTGPHPSALSLNPRGTITSSSSSKTPWAKSARTAAGTAHCRIKPISSSQMPVRIG